MVHADINLPTEKHPDYHLQQIQWLLLNHGSFDEVVLTNERCRVTFELGNDEPITLALLWHGLSPLALKSPSAIFNAIFSSSLLIQLVPRMLPRIRHTSIIRLLLSQIKLSS